MNIAFFLTPKHEIVTLTESMTLRQAMEKMEYHKYSAVPVIDDEGRYRYTLSEGDILWYVKDHMDLSIKNSEKVNISQIERSRSIEAVSINEEFSVVEELTQYQNFIPVVDDTGIFIGIIRRSDMMAKHFEYDNNKKVRKFKLNWAEA
ncbi:CBS domain-containing protein [Vallitaleaceae bacterium 9-2]